MTKYIISYFIEGQFECEAESKEEAADKFGEVSLMELAEQGTLDSDEPRTEAEMAHLHSTDLEAFRSWLDRIPKGEKV